MKSETFEIRTFRRSDFKWSGFSYSPNNSKSRRFCPDFKWFLTKWQSFVMISNGWASWFQILFEIQTIFNPTFFWPLKIQISRDFSSHCTLMIWILDIQLSEPYVFKSCDKADHLQPNLFWIIQNPDLVRFQIPTVHNFASV